MSDDCMLAAGAAGAHVAMAQHRFYSGCGIAEDEMARPGWWQWCRRPLKREVAVVEGEKMMLELYLLLMLAAAAFALAVYLLRNDAGDGGIPPWNEAGRGSSVTRSEQRAWDYAARTAGAWHPDAINEDGTLKRDVHHNVTNCVHCGGALETPCSTMTRDEWFCDECKSKWRVAPA